MTTEHDFNSLQQWKCAALGTLPNWMYPAFFWFTRVLVLKKMHITVKVPFFHLDYPSMTETSEPISKIVLVTHLLHLAVLYPSEIYKYYKISSYYLYIRRIMLPHLLQKLESVIYEYYLHYC